MAGTTGPNHPDGRKPRRQSATTATAAVGRGQAVTGSVASTRCTTASGGVTSSRSVEASEAEQGAAGVDAQTIAEVEQYGVERFLEELGDVLRAGEYRPSAVLRRYIPKADGKQRPLGIPTVRDRVVQMAAKLVLEPIFEADFLPCSYGFRPKRSATMALETLRKRGCQGQPSRARRRHPRLLRQHRPRQADEARGATRLGSAGAQADAAVARSRCDGRRRAAVDDDRGYAAGRGDLAAAVEHLPARARRRVEAPQCPRRARWCATPTISS